MAQTTLKPSNQSCWNCSTSIPQVTNATSGVLVTKDEAIILSVVCAVASVVGTLGNSLVLLAVHNLKRHRKIPDLFITSLAFSDISVCALFLPMMISSLNLIARDAYDKYDKYVILDSAKLFIGHASMVASASNMFAVTVDRVIAIGFPYKYVVVMTTRNTLTAIVVIWFVSLTFGVLYTRDFISTTYVSSYNLTMLSSTLTMYIYIFVAAKRQEDRVQNIPRGPDAVAAEKKVAKTIFTVVGAYTLCWAPLFLFPAFVHPLRNPLLFRKGFLWIQILLAINSAVNPYIYCIRREKYRTAFCKILKIQRNNDRQ